MQSPAMVWHEAQRCPEMPRQDRRLVLRATHEIELEKLAVQA